MPYLGATQLAAALPGVGTITGSSVPLTLGEVGTIIARVSGELDAAAAAAGYAVPLAPPASGGPSDAWALLEALTEYGAGWKVLRTVFPNMGGQSDRVSLAAEYRDAYMAALKMIRDGSTVLVGAGLSSTSRQLPRSYWTSNSGDAADLFASPMTVELAL